MMHTFVTVGFFLFSIRTILFWTSLWQVKEYRLDRLLAHLWETHQGRRLLFSPYTIIILLAILGYGFVIYNDAASFWYDAAITLLFVLFGSYFLFSVFRFSFRRPHLTAKSGLLLLLSFVLVIFLYFLSLVDLYLWVLVLALFIPLYVAFFVALFSFPSEIYTDIIIQKAKNILKKNRTVTVIAVSGSYGKSSTKEYLSHILGTKFVVAKTPLSNNTPIGIAKAILRNVTKDTQFFIVEMGAYKKGEIAKLCEIVRPDISITTAISDQHLSLYGSVENVIASEKELLDALPRKGTALMNANSPFVTDLQNQVKHKVLLYGTDAVKKKKLAILGSDILVKKNNVTFTTHMGRKKMVYTAPLLGAHTVENILPAILLAKSFGMQEEEIKHAVASLQPLEKTMKKVSLINGVVGIDDTFNASPESVFSALAYIQVFHKKKFFVMTPLIELGKHAKDRHEEIGKALSSCTKVFLTNKNFSHAIIEGLHRVNAKTEVVVLSKTAIAHALFQEAKKGDVIVFEGKESGKVLEELL